MEPSSLQSGLLDFPPSVTLSVQCGIAGIIKAGLKFCSKHSIRESCSYQRSLLWFTFLFFCRFAVWHVVGAVPTSYSIVHMAAILNIVGQSRVFQCSHALALQTKKKKNACI